MMAKQPADTPTTDLFDSTLSENIGHEKVAGHTMILGATGVGKTVVFAELMSRASRKLPSDGTSRDITACELCGTRHHGPCQRTRWGGK